MKIPTKEDILNGYTGNLPWLASQTFYICLHGSHAYGTNIEGSDIDFKGLAVAPKNYSTGFLNKFEQAEGPFGEYDGAIYDVRKFIGLALDNNPSVMEVLWADPSTWIYNNGFSQPIGFATAPGKIGHPITPFEKLYAARWDFLSQQAKHRYSGYAVSQHHKIALHRQYLLNPPKKKPEREDFQLPGSPKIPKEQREALEAVMQKQIEAWRLDFGDVEHAYRIDLINKLAENLADMKLSVEDQYYAASAKIGLDVEAMEYLKKERAYKNAVNEWAKYQEWQKNRNPKRAALEASHGYDLKHAMHCVRLQRTCLEILEGKGIVVKRPDAEELKAIRNGAYTYDQFCQMVKDLDDKCNKAMENTNLPRQGNRILADKICQEIVESMW